MKINELVVHESKLYYLEQLYLEEGIADTLGKGVAKAANWLGKGVGGIAGGLRGAGTQFSQGFKGAYQGSKSAVAGQAGTATQQAPAQPAAQASAPDAAAPQQASTKPAPAATGAATSTTATLTAYQQVQRQISKLSNPEKQQLIRLLQQLIQRSKKPAAV